MFSAFLKSPNNIRSILGDSGTFEDNNYDVGTDRCGDVRIACSLTKAEALAGTGPFSSGEDVSDKESCSMEANKG